MPNKSTTKCAVAGFEQAPQDSLNPPLNTDTQNIMTKKKPVSELSFLSRMPVGNPLSEAIILSGAVSKSDFAKRLSLGKVDPETGVITGSRQAVSEWFRRGSIPKKYALAIFKMVEGKIPLEKLLMPFEPYKPATDEAIEAEILGAAAAPVEKETAREKSPAVINVESVLKRKAPRKKSS